MSNNYAFKNISFSNLFRPNTPDSFQIDSGLADAITVVAFCAAECCDVASELNADESADIEEVDLAVRLRAAIALREIDPTHAFDAMAYVLQALCSVADANIAEFFRTHVATTVADIVRSDSPLKPVWVNPVEYSIYEPGLHELGAEIDAEHPNAVRRAREHLTPTVHRVGAMLANLKLTPLGMTSYSDGAGDGTSILFRWSIDAALMALFDEFEEGLLVPEALELVAVLVVALTEVFTWLDEIIAPGSSTAVIHHLANEFVARNVAKLHNFSTDGSSDVGEAA